MDARNFPAAYPEIKRHILESTVYKSRQNKGEGDTGMEQQPIHKNEVFLTGVVLEAPEYSHCNHDERFYKFSMEIMRLSGQKDVLVVVLNERLAEQVGFFCGARIHVEGQLRSYNNKSGKGSRLVLTVFARTLSLSEAEDHNEILLCGVLCKPPVLRSTPLGRSICDLMLAVNRPYGRSDYIPCIAWGALAGETGLLRIGDSLSFEGRIQSRTYHKMTAQGVECRVAYEVSVMCLREIEMQSCIFLPAGRS